MTRNLAVLLSAAALGLPFPAAAQDAAETAIILGGTGQAQGRAQRSLGESIARGMGNAANAVLAANRARGPSRADGRQARRAGGGGNAGKFAIALPGDVDPLERTDAPQYELANGATIRVSGGLRRPLKPAAEASPRPE